jgi:hypothetical protein
MWPQPVAFEDVLAQARSRLALHASSDPADDARVLGDALVKLCGRNWKRMRLWLHPPAFVTQVSEKPIVSHLARLQAANGMSIVASLCHQPVSLAPLGVRLLQLLDGTHDRGSLVDTLVSSVHNGQVERPEWAKPLADVSDIRIGIAKFVDTRLPLYAELGLLIG